MKKEFLISLEEFEEAEKYWLDKLAGELTDAKLVSDYPGHGKYRPGNYSLTIEDSLKEKLLQISKNNDLSLYIILLTIFKILLARYTGENDIIVVSPIYTQSNREYNKLVALRDFLPPMMTFKELLMEVKRSVVEGYKNEHYPLEQLIEYLELDDSLLFRNIFLCEQIHEKEFIREIIDQSLCDLLFAVSKNQEKLTGEIIYNAGLFKQETIQQMFARYLRIAAQVLNSLDIKLCDIRWMTDEEKSQVLFVFNNTGNECFPDKTLNELFDRQAEKTPEHVAVHTVVDLNRVFARSTPGKINMTELEEIENCCFKKNQYIYESHLEVAGKDSGYRILKTHLHNSVIVDKNTLYIINCFDGETNVKSIFSQIKTKNLRLTLYPVGPDDILEIVVKFSEKEEILLDGRLESFVHLLKLLYLHHLIRPMGINPHWTNVNSLTGVQWESIEFSRGSILSDDLLVQNKEPSKAEVLLIGDTPGMSTVGLLYMASYLRRNGIKAYCRFTDVNPDKSRLEKDILGLLRTIQPEVVAVSMKWFPYMARVLEICRIVKTYSPGTRVVVGGNTASYYWQEVIRNEFIDYVIRGDGEEPLLKISQGVSPGDIPNCVYKKNGKILTNPITYVQDKTNSSEIYLSHLDEILLSTCAPLFGSFFIWTHKGCDMNCFYCAGCRETQKKIFKRTSLHVRSIKEVRKDILEAKKYTSTFVFDFDAPNLRLVEYCQKMWEGIDLSSHFCLYVNIFPPSPELIKLVNQTFKYVYCELDMASLSERHRKELFSLGLVKPQPSDDEILAFFEECEKYDNNEVRINLINGLPYFTREDIRGSDRLFSKITDFYSCFSNLHWGRLHAQPGAPVTENADDYDMYSLASTFVEFLKISQINFQKHSTFSTIEYPFIYYKNEELNSIISNYYAETNLKLANFKRKKESQVAVNKNISYKDLNRRVHHLANQLRNKGVTTGNVVGIIAQQPLTIVESILGTLKAGGAYLPIDSGYPEKVKEYMIKDSNMQLLVSEPALVEDLPPGLLTLPVVFPAEDSQGKYDTPDLPLVNKSRDPAYVIYTSGTTGRPKGTLVAHRGVVNYTYWRKQAYRYSQEDVTLQLLSYGFDGFGSNFYSSLLSGGVLIMVPASRRLDYDYIKELIKRKGVTNVSLVPGMYEGIIENSTVEELKTLRFVVLAGEKCKEDIIKKSKEIVPGLLLINEYGPTEATVTAAAHLGLDEFSTAIIGPPIANTCAYICDESRQTVPINVAGELLIAGPGVARGYLNHPELTAEKFVFYPHHKGKPVYCSGDRARWLPDGNIELLGRKDQQVKVRGFRIELREIESLLAAHKEIKDAVVSAKEDEHGDYFLCAYYVSESRDTQLEANELREYLLKRLPEHVIPSFFIPLEAIPYTHHGKVDRKSLPAPEIKIKGEYIAPANPIEEKIAEIWSDVLGVEKGIIGMNSNFFELGGHSLKATVLVSRIHKELNVKVPLQRVFETPTIREFSRGIQAVMGEKYVRIEPVEKKEYYPLSSAQKRLYFIQQMDVNTTSYNNPFVFPLGKDMEKGKLELTVNQLITRHESLRTSFVMVDGNPVQQVHYQQELVIEYYDYEDTSDSTSPPEMIIHNFVRPFDLSRGPLIRSGLLKLRDKHHLWLVDIHHIISDGTSMTVLTEDFLALYPGEELPHLRIQYKDFSEWQGHLVDSGRLKAQEDYWLTLFSDAAEIPKLNLPTDYRRPEVFTFVGDKYEFSLETKNSTLFKNLVSRANSTLFMNTLAALNTLFYKYTGQTDIVIGCGIAGRTHADLQRTIGMFVNTLPMRNHPQGNQTYEDFLNEVMARSVEAFANQDLQFEALVDKLEPERDTSRNPLVDILILVQNFRTPGENPAEQDFSGQMQVLPLADETLPTLELENTTSKLDMTFFIQETGEDILITIEYYTAIYKKETIVRLARHFKQLIKEIGSDPTLPLKDIDIVTEEEKQQLLFQFNDTGFPYPREKTVTELFEGQVEKTPDHTALIGQEGVIGLAPLPVHVTYKELNRRVHQLAHPLIKKGVRSDTIVAITAERSIEMIVGILGILKAGGAYLPIDPDYPDDRIFYLLEDSGVKILVTTSILVKEGEKVRGWGGDILPLWGEESQRTEFSRNTIPDRGDRRAVKVGNLAYVIYTSGSTGKSKGVLIEQPSVINVLLALDKKYPFSQRDAYLLKTSYLFDVSVTELFGWFLGGGRLVILEKGAEKDPPQILDTIERHGVTHVNFVPSMFNAFLEVLDSQNVDKISRLKYLFLAGEALLPDMVKRFQRLNPGILLENIYGPTENTIYASAYSLSQWDGNSDIPIGKPLQNIKLYVLDKYQQLQPVGVLGELCLGGAGLARGYLNRPELTVDRFVNSHLSLVTGSSDQTPKTNNRCLMTDNRLYKTGDLVRWLPDENIEFLGRMDLQVKIRGFRIELGEIENHLIRHQGIKDAMVVARDNEKNNKSLCAYFVCGNTIAGDKPLDIADLRDYLALRLPDYMVPSYFVPLKQIPLTSTGKVDRKALPEPEFRPTKKGYVPPGNKVERLLVQTWEDVLAIKPIGITDKFFAVGGDSIKAIQVSARLKTYGLELKISDLFLKQTIKELGRTVTKTQRTIPQGIIQGEVELTPFQQWLFKSNPKGNHHFNQAVMVYCKMGFDEETLKKVFTKILEHHDALRIVYKTRGNSVIQLNRGLEENLFDFEAFDMKQPQDSQVEKRIEAEANRIQRGINLNTGPLIKIALFKTPEGDHLLMVIHHLAVDGISWRILLEDLAAGYRQVEQGKEVRFPDKTDSFKEWSKQLKQYAQSNQLLKELEYWKKLEETNLQPISKDYQIGPGKKKVKHIETMTMKLDEGHTQALIKKVNRVYNTEINDILLTALALAIDDWQGLKKILINLEGHGREEVINSLDISRTVGWFTSQYPVLLKVGSGSDLSYAIKMVKEILRQVPAKGIGYGILKYLTPLEKKKGKFFQLEPEISFNYLGQFGVGEDGASDKELFRVSPLSTGQSINPELYFPSAIEINGQIMERKLSVSFYFNCYEFKRKNIEKLVSSFKSNLIKIIRHCLQKEKRELTPSDVSNIPLSIENLEALETRISKSGKDLEIEQIYPLTPMQAGMFYHALKGEGAGTDFGQLLLTLEGEVDCSLLESSLDNVLNRYEVLRAVFISEGLSSPLQVILKERKARIHYLDIIHLTGPAQEQYMDTMLSGHRKKGFDLTKNIPIAMTLVRIGENRFNLVVEFHHIVMDGWCLGIVFKELLQVYKLLKQGKPATLEPVTPYKDYMQWLENQDKQEGLRYWQGYLEDYRQSVSLQPVETGSTPSNDQYQLEIHPLVLDEGLTSSFNEIALQHQATVNSVFQTLWGILLQQYNSTNDVVFGTVVSGRTPEVPGIENMVGMFINTVPVRIISRQGQTFSQLLRDVQEREILSKSYDYTPLAEIQAGSLLKGNLFDHIVAFENFPLQEVTKDLDNQKEFGFCIEENIEAQFQGNYHLNISVIPGTCLNIEFHYNSLVYKSELINTAASHLEEVIKTVIKNPDIPLTEIDMMSEEEKAKILFKSGLVQGEGEYDF